MPQPDSSEGSLAQQLLDRLLRPAGRSGRLTHVQRVPGRPGQPVGWPPWVPPALVEALLGNGVQAPWRHQVQAAELARSGRHTVVATGTASGKSLCYLLPALSAALEAADDRRIAAPPTTLYVSPTKALAADQLRALAELGLAAVRAATYDGDTPSESRDWARRHASYVLTNPDLLHRSLLPGHQRWARFLRGLRYVVLDECHRYRGVFGSHVAAVLRRLQRVCAHYGSDPVFVLTSATVAEPAASATRLVGRPVVAVTQDGSPRGSLLFALWEPPLTTLAGERGAPVRRSATAEVAELLADLVADGVRTVAFVRSRRAAETVAATTRRLLAQADAELPGRVAAYRAGYLPEERRALEADLKSGQLLGVASTNALELGVDIAGLDAVLLAGWPGTAASLWQQAGRAGRAGQDALAVLVARDDPLDTYLTHHPAALFGRSVEATVLDPANPHILAPHLCAAAAELPPLADHELTGFADGAPAVVEHLVEQGLLRRRTTGLYWTGTERASDLTDIRGVGAGPVGLVEEGTGRLLGTVDGAAAHLSVHPGAVYVHQGETYLVDTLDHGAQLARVRRADPDWTTVARDVTDIEVVSASSSRSWPGVRVSFGTVQVTSQVVSFLRLCLATGEVRGEEVLDLPPRRLHTRAVWWTVDTPGLARAGLAPQAVAGAAHAAEHASIGLLPLFATCDPWDVGGASTAHHADTGLMTVFVYDGHPGGAGFAERGHAAALDWLGATRTAIAACECLDGCPSCVQSPSCGSRNDPLDELGAVRLLDVVLAAATSDRESDRAAVGPRGA